MMKRLLYFEREYKILKVAKILIMLKNILN